MADSNSGTNQTPFYAVPKNPIIDAEKLLTGQYSALNGMITIPITDSMRNLIDAKAETPSITIPFHLENNFSFGLGNKWESLVPDTAGEFLDTIYNLLSMGNILQGSQFKVMSRAMQTLAWKGSENPEFSISATFVCTQRNYNPVSIMRILSACCLPLSREEASADSQKAITEAVNKVEEVAKTAIEKISQWNQQLGASAKDLSDKSISALRSMGLVAPLEYHPVVDIPTDSSSITKGGVLLTIGNWFAAQDLLVKSISNIEFSKEVIAPQPSWVVSENIEKSDEYGFPLYAKCQMTLVPYRPITFGDFCNYFTGASKIKSY